jgi:hypothetical protein
MTDATAPSAPPAQQPGAEDLFEIFYAPAKVFERRQAGQFGLPLVVLAVLAGVLYVATRGLMQPMYDAEAAVQLAKTTAGMSADQAEKVRAASQSIGGIITTITMPIVFLVAPFLIAAVAWLVALIVGAKTRYGVVVMIATFSWFPRLVEMVFMAVQMAVMPNLQPTSRLALSLGAGRFVDGSHPSITTALLGRVDLFTFWCSFLLGIGFVVAGKATKAQAIAIAAIMWAIGILPGVWAALR